jgi:hypothetical protein
LALFALNAFGCGSDNSPPNREEVPDDSRTSRVGDSHPDTATARANELVGLHFVSVDKLRAGGGPAGPEFAHKHLSFREETCRRGYANVFVHGTFTLSENGSIQASFGPEVTWNVSGAFDAQTNELVWDGARYVVEPPLSQKTLDAGRNPTNQRVRALVTYLADQGTTLAYTQAGYWRVVQPDPPYGHVDVRLWSFPAAACDYQIQRAIEAADEKYRWNVVSHIAMSEPRYRGADGKVLEVPADNEVVPQLAARFDSYSSADTPWCPIVNPGSDPNDHRIQALIGYFARNGIHLEPDDRDGWRLTKPETPDGYDVIFSIRTFPEWASEDQMRWSLMQINLAYMLNGPARLAMSYGSRRGAAAGGQLPAADAESPRHNGLPVNEAIQQLFKNYPAR